MPESLDVLVIKDPETGAGFPDMLEPEQAEIVAEHEHGPGICVIESDQLDLLLPYAVTALGLGHPMVIAGPHAEALRSGALELLPDS
jgi:hypothetical protein